MACCLSVELAIVDMLASSGDITGEPSPSHVSVDSVPAGGSSALNGGYNPSELVVSVKLASSGLYSPNPSETVV